MKETSEIFETMLQVFREKTGYDAEPGSDLAVRLYAAAAQLRDLEERADFVLAQSFPQTAQGAYLTLHGQLRGVTRREAVCASGTLRFFVETARTQDLSVPAGTAACTAGGTRFVTTQDAVLPAGSLTVDVPARAQEPGPGGNAGSGAVHTLTAPLRGMGGVTNPLPFTGGAAAEDDAAFRERVLGAFRSLPNGANAAYYEARAMAHPGVAAVQVTPRNAGVGTVGVTIAAADGVPTQELLDAVQADLDAVREIAVDVTVSAPDTEEIFVSAEILPKPGVEFSAAKAAAEAAVGGFFTGALLGRPVYRQALGRAIYDTGLVENYCITAPAADVAGASGTLPVLSGCGITEAEA